VREIGREVVDRKFGQQANDRARNALGDQDDRLELAGRRVDAPVQSAPESLEFARLAPSRQVGAGE
jgi:hypothetical protein